VRARTRWRLFAAQDLGLLEGPDRDQWQKPEQIMDALRIADGSRRRRAWSRRRVVHDPAGAPRRPNGIVYAEDIQPEMIERLDRRVVKQENLPWVRPVLGTANDPRLPAGIDAVVIVETFAEMQLPPTNPVLLLRKTPRVVESRRPASVLSISVRVTAAPGLRGTAHRSLCGRQRGDGRGLSAHRA
jgi:hypothetical protein